MKPFYQDLETETLKNKYYRRVVYTTPQMQLVYMSIAPGDQIEKEKHHNITQFIRIESGEGIAIIDDENYVLASGIALMIPPDTYHQVINLSKTKEMKIYTLYSPPAH